VYHLHLVITQKASNEEGEEIVHYRLILNKMGIQRLEKMEDL
jgi:hypothetical protein